MANVVETIERDGVKVLVYDNGMERNAENGRMMKPATGTVITPERATLLHRRRQEKAAAALRDAIKREHNSKMTPTANSSAAVFAESGALLYSEVVLNADAYPRDRMEAWEKLGKYAQVLPSDLRKQDGEPAAAAVAAGIASGLVGVLERVMRDVLAQQRDSAEVVEGKVNDGQLED